MMFSSSPLDKGCVSPDNCSSGRHNSSNRFPVGITSLGDENQQSRIQLAVHKYNSSANTAINSRCSLISPVRHNYLKTSLKAKNYEGDTDGGLKNEKKTRNQYEGVGAFPTVHLKKSAVRYRPIKKFNDVKIPYPELPVNRYLSHLPEVCSDMKSSTRSVLDVLEDLSGKKIHSKQDSTSSKLKSKGLGGDHLLNPNTVYKPLFVQKPKLNSVLTRDSTTQTLCPLSTELQGPQINNSLNKSDDSDPRAELRRKLAKQNNEIFASLSSSISSAFALKRKIDKVMSTRDDEQLTDGSATKKSKISDHELNNYTENGVSKPSRSKTNVNDSTKSIRKTKFSETSTPTSPKKDRLTTIFLDMQNTSPKSQIFQNQATSTEKSTENDTQPSTSLSNGFTRTTDTSGSKTSSPLFNGSTVTRAGESGKSESEKPPSAEKTESADSKKVESEQPSKPMFNFPLSKAETITNDVTKFTAPTFQFGVNTSTGSNFNLGNTSVVDSAKSSDSSSNITKKENNTEKKDNNNQVSITPFTFGKTNDKPAFGTFKFGTNDNVSLPSLITSPKDPKAQTVNTPVIPTTASATVPQFSFVTATTTTTTAATTQQPSIVSTAQAVQFGATSVQGMLSIPAKPTFTFGQSVSSGHENFVANKTPERKPLANGLQTSIAETTQSIQPVAFTFGQKPNLDSLTKTSTGQGVENQTAAVVSFSPSTTSLSTSSTVATQSSKNFFSFAQKSETPANSTPSAPASEGQKISFSFGQKSDADQSKAQEGSGQKSTGLFSFGQKPAAQEPTKGTLTSPAVTSQEQPASTQTTSVFGQNVSQPATTSQVQFGKAPATQVTNGLGPKSESGFLGNNPTPAFSQSNTAFPIKTPLFGSSMTGFGSASTQASAGFGTTTSAPKLSFGSPTVAQSTSAFDTSSATQPGLSFGVSSASQSGFGSSPALQSASAFGVSSTTQSTPVFGVSSTTQSIPAFGVSSTAQSTQSTSTFGVSTTAQSTPIFGVSSSSQPSNGFGALASSVGTFPVQSNSGFGAPAVTSTSGFGVSQPSFSQPLGNKPTTSLGQPTSVFGQNPGPSFASSTAFGSGQNNVFSQKANRDGDVFEQNKLQAPSFNAQNKFSFGMSTSNATGFTTSPPKTTAAPVFSFGGSTTANTFSFGSNNSAMNSMQTPFTFKSPTNEPFKFGATNAKEEQGAGFPATTPSTFSFGGQMNNNAMGEQKPSFSFGNTQVSSSAPFTFGSTPSPSLFSFGSSTSASSGSSFNFGTPNPANNPFGQTPSASPGTPFAVPGTFSIGSGTSQSRPRATSRPRRRP